MTNIILYFLLVLCVYALRWGLRSKKRRKEVLSMDPYPALGILLGAILVKEEWDMKLLRIAAVLAGVGVCYLFSHFWKKSM